MRTERRPQLGIVTLVAAATLAVVSRAAAQVPTPGPGAYVPPAARVIDLEQKLGDTVPLDASFIDEAGRTVALRDYFGRRPVLIVLAYYRCPMLCGIVMQGLAEGLREVKEKPGYTAGKDYEVVIISIDPRENPALAQAKKDTYVAHFGRNLTEDGWHFLTSTGHEPDVKRVADALGYHFAYDQASDQYAHPAGVMVITQDGVISRYLYGASYRPLDIRLALVDASEGKVGTVADKILQRCFQYDPLTGRYGFAIRTALRAGAVVTVVGLVLFLWVMTLRAKKRAAIDGPGVGPAPAQSPAGAEVHSP